MYLLIFGTGVAGAVAREVFRWRTLYLAGRLDKYLKPTYIIIAAIIVVLAGVSALVFAPFLTSDIQVQLPIAFVIGAGFELLVQLAARLQMPSISMGADITNRADEATKFVAKPTKRAAILTDRPANLGEFLRV